MKSARFHKPVRFASALLTMTVASLALVGCNLEEESISGPVGLQSKPLTTLKTSAGVETVETFEASYEPMMVSLEALRSSSRGGAAVRIEGGFPVSVMAQVPVEGADAAARAHAYVRQYGELFRQTQPELSLLTLRVFSVDGARTEHVRIGQTFKGLEVFGADMVVLLDGNQVLGSFGKLATAPYDVNTIPGMTQAEAEKLARTYLEDSEAPRRSDTRLMVFDGRFFGAKDRMPQLVYRMLFGGRHSRQLLIDAHTGKLVADLATEHSSVLDDFDYQLFDGMGSNSKDSDCYSDVNSVEAGDEYAIDSAYSADVAAKGVWTFDRWAWLFYANTFGQISYDNDGEQMESYFHSNTAGSASYSIACDLFQYQDVAISHDISTHELTHAVINETSALVYMGTSGALNESYADVMAALADGNWTIGESSGMKAFRSLKDPSIFSQPMKASDVSLPAQPWDNTNDYGGVHTNSGVPNYAHYLMSVGGAAQGYTVQGIGNYKMGWLAYHALRTLSSNAGFFEARDVEVTLAKQLVSSGKYGMTASDLCQVRNAWAAVEVGFGDKDCDGYEDNVDGDDDNDGVQDVVDNCPTVANPSQTSSFDGDNLGDACDPDDDNDGVPDTEDNCGRFNPDQKDTNFNFLGDACEDYDLDGVFDQDDNCMVDPNADQKDSDGDGEGDACSLDHDQDGIFGAGDNCLFVSNVDQADADQDGIGDACDPCPKVAGDVLYYTTGIPELGIPPKPMGHDADGDGEPDACDASPIGPKRYFEIDENPFDPNGIFVDGAAHSVELGGMAGDVLSVPLNLCPRGECLQERPLPGLVQISMAQLDERMSFKVVDHNGYIVAKSGSVQPEGAEAPVLRFSPEQGRAYKLMVSFARDISTKRPANLTVMASF